MTINTDKDYLQTIMQNLTANAVQALQQMPKATIVWKAWQEGEISFLSIQDNGPGINEDIQKRLGNGAMPLRSDTGLGLSIIKDMANAINCNIRFQSNDAGTLVTLSIAEAL
jgi:C4-dicarboxylate-specific signal transduction histidine kinase